MEIKHPNPLGHDTEFYSHFQDTNNKLPVHLFVNEVS